MAGKMFARFGVIVLCFLITGLATPNASALVTISDNQIAGPGPNGQVGWDTVMWTSRWNSQWYVFLRFWDVGYHPSSVMDAGGNRADDRIASGTTDVINYGFSYFTKGRLAGHFVNPDGLIYYCHYIEGVTWAGTSSFAYGPVMAYDVP